MGPAYARYFRRVADRVRSAGIEMDSWQWRVLYLTMRGGARNITLDSPRRKR